MWSWKKENVLLLKTIDKNVDVNLEAKNNANSYFYTRKVYVQTHPPLERARRYVKRKINVPISRIAWNYLKGQAMEQAVENALRKLGIRENRGYRIKEHYVWQNGVDVYAYKISDGEPILGIECKNFSPQGYLTMIEAQRTIKNLEPFKYKLLLFSHRQNILNLKPEIMKIFKDTGIELGYLGKEIIPLEIWDCFWFKRSQLTNLTFWNPNNLREEEEEIAKTLELELESRPFSKRTVKLVAKKLFRILYRIGAVSLIVYFVYTEKKDEVSKKKYRARTIIISASATYFHKFGDAQYTLVRKNQYFEANFIDPTYAIELDFTLPIKHCIHRYCKYRWECESFEAPASACPRLKGRKECERFFENKRWKARANAILRERKFKGSNCVYCGNPVKKDDDWIYVRIKKRKRIVHRKCLRNPTLLKWITSSPLALSA